MIARADDNLLKDCLEDLRENPVEEIEGLEPSVVRIGPFTCDLKEKWFSARLLSGNRKLTAEFKGTFQRDGTGQWRGVLTSVSSWHAKD
jgi:hypothetical protein